jgi:hypothetical protein
MANDKSTPSTKFDAFENILSDFILLYNQQL